MPRVLSALTAFWPTVRRVGGTVPRVVAAWVTSRGRRQHRAFCYVCDAGADPATAGGGPRRAKLKGRCQSFKYDRFSSTQRHENVCSIPPKRGPGARTDLRSLSPFSDRDKKIIIDSPCGRRPEEERLVSYRSAKYPFTCCAVCIDTHTAPCPAAVHRCIDLRRRRASSY